MLRTTCFTLLVFSFQIASGLTCLGQAVETGDLTEAVSSQLADKLVTKTHDLSGAISARIRSSNLPSDQAKSAVLSELFALHSQKENVKRNEISPGVYEVEAPASYHRYLSGYAQWMADGEKQIVIESRIVTVSEASLRELHSQFASQWEMTDVSEAPTADTKSASNASRLPDFGSFQQVEQTKRESISATTKVSQSLPCRIARISESQVKDLLQNAQSDTRTNLMQAPKVTLFPGQEAVVKDTTQRPFVTSVKPIVGKRGTAMQPIITVLEDGLTIRVRVSVHGEDDSMRVDSNITMGEIGDVDEFTFEGADEGSGTTVQIPEFLERTVHISKNLGESQSLIVDPHFFTETTVKRRFRRDTVSREFTVVILTPRVIQPHSEKVGPKVAKL